MNPTVDDSFSNFLCSPRLDEGQKVGEKGGSDKNVILTSKWIIYPGVLLTLSLLFPQQVIADCAWMWILTQPLLSSYSPDGPTTVLLLQTPKFLVLSSNKHMHIMWDQYFAKSIIETHSVWGLRHNFQESLWFWNYMCIIDKTIICFQ